MTTFICLASGKSLNDVDFSLVRKSGLPVIACNRAWEAYPDANFLCAADKAFWKEYKPEFSGLKVSRNSIKGNIWFNPPDCPAGCNTGLFALYWAKACNARKVILLGYDLHGGHFHPDHPLGLKNPSQDDFARYIRQFDRFSGPDIIQCTPDSALPYPYIELEKALWTLLLNK